MIGAGVQVRLDSRSDRVRVSPCYEGVDQAVGAAVLEISLVEATLEQVVPIVRELEEELRVFAGDRAGTVWIGLKDHSLFRAQQRLRSQRSPGVSGVFGNDEVRMGSRTPPTRQLDHLRTYSSQNTGRCACRAGDWYRTTSIASRYAAIRASGLR